MCRRILITPLNKKALVLNGFSPLKDVSGFMLFVLTSPGKNASSRDGIVSSLNPKKLSRPSINVTNSVTCICFNKEVAKEIFQG